MTDPHGLEYLWPWLCDIARSSRTDVPLAIHSQSGDRNGWGSLVKKDQAGKRIEEMPTLSQSEANAARQSAVRGLPFSRTFLRRVDHELPPLLRQALASLRPSSDDEYAIRSARKAQWRVVNSVIKNGETETEAVRTRLGMTDYAFRVAAVSGILALRSALEREA